LYKDKSGEHLLASSAPEAKEVTLTVKRNNASLEQSSEPGLEEIKIDRDFDTWSTLHYNKAGDELSYSRGSLGDPFKCYTS
jgi:hypothetical protein